MLRCCTIVLLLSNLISTPASAHPHVFIDARAAFLFDDSGKLDALRITWIYDAFTSLSLVAQLDLDQDNDGTLSKADLDRVVKAQTIWPDSFKGDTYLEISGAPAALARPTNGAATFADGQIAVSFELPLENPMDIRSKAELRLYDPTYYYAYKTVDAQTSVDCQIMVQPFEPDRATSKLKTQLSRLSREETPEQTGIGRLFADVIELQCP